MNPGGKEWGWGEKVSANRKGAGFGLPFFAPSFCAVSEARSHCVVSKKPCPAGRRAGFQDEGRLTGGIKRFWILATAARIHQTRLQPFLLRSSTWYLSVDQGGRT